MAKTNLTAERLRELLKYCPDTGLFTWRVIRSCGRKGKTTPGDTAGSAHGNGYVQIGIDGEKFFAHRLAWFYSHGEWPKLIDHINRDRSDNRICNLRLATSVQNGLNARARNPISGVKGVHQLPSGKWRAIIKHNYRVRHIGCFDTIEEATEARQAVEDSLFMHEASKLLGGNLGTHAQPGGTESASP